jgi:ABC-type arginine/histidine transport system permease subunit
LWIELAIGIVSAAVGVVVSLSIGILQLSDSRVAMIQLQGFLTDWRADSTYRIGAVQDSTREILAKLS